MDRRRNPRADRRPYRALSTAAAARRESGLAGVELLGARHYAHPTARQIQLHHLELPGFLVSWLVCIFAYALLPVARLYMSKDLDDISA